MPDEKWLVLQVENILYAVQNATGSSGTNTPLSIDSASLECLGEATRCLVSILAAATLLRANSGSY